MAAPALLLDEDVRVVLADILRQRGYDAIHVLEIGRAGRDDLDQFTYAVSQERALRTHNIRDFWPLTIDTALRDMNTSESLSPTIGTETVAIHRIGQ